jgi:hypothetical protein
MRALDESIHVAEGDIAGRLVRPGKEELEIADVVDGRRSVRVLAEEPFLEMLDFGYYEALLVVIADR